MGEGEARRSPAARIVFGALRFAFALVLFIFCLLLILRGLAAWRESDRSAPPGTTFFATSDVRMAARVSGPANGAPVVLVHGTAAWSGFWKDVADHLAARGWRVIAVDLPPFGWSGRDPASRYDRATQARRLGQAIGQVGRPAIVVGHSFGAGAVAELAIRDPGKVQGLVLVDAALGEFNPSSEAPIAAAFRLRPLSELAAAAMITNPNSTEPFLRSLIARKDQAHRWVGILQEPMIRKGSTSAYAAWLPNLFTRRDGALSRQSANLQAIHAPVALIWGQADTVTPLPQGRRIAKLTNARSLTVLQGVGHIPHIEDPARFQAALDRALDQVKRGAE